MTWALMSLAASLLSQPAAAVDLKAMEGVWEGTIGSVPIRACYDAGAYRNEGKYFYARHLKTIPLIGDGRKPGDLTEGWAASKGEPRWTVTRVTEGRLEGRWRGQGSILPIRLVRVPFETDQAYDRACSSMAFVGPIVEATRIARARDRFAGGLAADQLTLVYPDDNVSVVSFQLPGSDAATVAINRRLMAPFDQADEGWTFCLRNAGAFGADYHEAVEPAFASSRWLMVNVSTDSFCGGAHPNSSNDPLLFDRTTGATVDLYDWFASAAVVRTPVEGYGTIDTLGPALRKHVVDRLALDDRECRASVDSARSWGLALTAKGMAFTPDLPRVVMACGVTAVLPWKELTEYLNPTGQREVAALQDERRDR